MMDAGRLVVRWNNTTPRKQTKGKTTTEVEGPCEDRHETIRQG